MSDLDDFDHCGVYLQRYKFNALTAVYLLEDLDLGVGSLWVGDTLTRRRGFGKAGDGVFEFYMTPVGSEPPKTPQDDKFKPAVGMLWWSPEHGLAEMITNSSLLRRTISDIWDTYKTYRQAADWLLLVTEFGAPREVKVGKNNTRIFWTPVLTIVDCMPRDQIPALKYRPPTVPPPIRLDQQIPFRAPALLPPAKDRRRRSAPEQLSDLLDDELPELGGAGQ